MYRLKVTVEKIDGYCNQPMIVGDHFFVDGGKINPWRKTYVSVGTSEHDADLPASPERESSENDWTSKVNQFCCPDPKGRVHYRIERVKE